MWADSVPRMTESVLRFRYAAGEGAGDMRTYRIVMVEDSDAEAATLASHLRRYADEQGVRFSVTRLASAVDLECDHAGADLVFMDIDLPGMNGMEAAAELRRHDPDVPLVFVTNLAQYAVRGYQVDALDFMVKPVGYEDFRMRMARAMRAMERNFVQTRLVADPDGSRVVALRDIVYLELVRHDLHYHLADGSTIRERGSIRAAEESLPSDTFLRMSQGCLVNMGHVALVRTDSVELDDGTQLYFSRSRKRACLDTLNRFLGGTI